MNNNHHKIFESSECLAHQQLVDYLDEKLSAKEKHLVEEHLVDCEMCSDELEGLELITNRNKLNMIVEEIKTKSLEKKFRIIPFIAKNRISSAAALLIILAAIIIVLQLSIKQNQQPLMAENTETFQEKPIEKDLGKSEQLVKDEKEIIEEKKAEVVVKKEEETTQMPAMIEMDMATADAVYEDEIEATTDVILIEDENEVYIPNDITLTEPGNAETYVEESKDLPNKELSKIVVVAERSEKKRINTSSVTKLNAKEIKKIPSVNSDAITSMQIMEVSTKGSRRSLQTDPMDKAMQKFNSEKYRAASKLFEEIISMDSTNFEAMYFVAQCSYEFKNYEKAEQYLKIIVSNEGNEYYLKAKELLEKHTP